MEVSGWPHPDRAWSSTRSAQRRPAGRFDPGQVLVGAAATPFPACARSHSSPSPTVRPRPRRRTFAGIAGHGLVRADRFPAGEDAVWMDSRPHGRKPASAADLKRRRKSPGPAALRRPVRREGQHRRRGPAHHCGCPEFAYTPGEPRPWSRRCSTPAPFPSARRISTSSPRGWSARVRRTAAARRVFDPPYISGGSSSGSAVAVAAGSGEFRAGHRHRRLRPRAGGVQQPRRPEADARAAVSTRGVVPACRTLDCVSVFAAHRRDALAVAGRRAGFDAADPYSRAGRASARRRGAAALPFRRAAAGPARILRRCGCRRVVRGRGARLERSGGQGRDRFLAVSRPRRLLYAGPWVAERLAAIDLHGAARRHPPGRERHRSGGRAYSAVDAFEAVPAAELTPRARRNGRRWTCWSLPTTGTIYTTKTCGRSGPAQHQPGILHQFREPAGPGRGAGRFPARRSAVRRHLRGPRVPGWCAGEPRRPAAPCARRRYARRHRRPLPGPALEPSERDLSQVAVVGAHLKGLPLHWQLTDRNARFVRLRKLLPATASMRCRAQCRRSRD